jgi:hypothetical protein
MANKQVGEKLQVRKEGECVFVHAELADPWLAPTRFAPAVACSLHGKLAGHQLTIVEEPVKTNFATRVKLRGHDACVQLVRLCHGISRCSRQPIIKAEQYPA